MLIAQRTPKKLKENSIIREGRTDMKANELCGGIEIYKKKTHRIEDTANNEEKSKKTKRVIHRIGTKNGTRENLR
ncbi:MAG: hypothetical protein Pars2KO_33500 [Parasphingorhabdus sp.]